MSKFRHKIKRGKIQKRVSCDESSELRIPISEYP